MSVVSCIRVSGCIPACCCLCVQRAVSAVRCWCRAVLHRSSFTLSSLNPRTMNASRNCWLPYITSWPSLDHEVSSVQLNVPSNLRCWSLVDWLKCFSQLITHTHTHTRLTALCPGLPRWAGTRKVKPIWILLKQETVSGSGISCAVCKSATRSSQITTPAPHHSVFYRLDALPAAQPTASKHWRQ